MRIDRLLAVCCGVVITVWPQVVHAQACCLPKLDENSAETANLIDGIQSATALMIVAPYVLVVIAGVWIYRRGHDTDSTDSIE